LVLHRQHACSGCHWTYRIWSASDEGRSWLGRVAVAIHCKSLSNHTRIRFVLIHFAQLEGLFTILVSFIFAALFPGRPQVSKSLLGIHYFNERELHIICQRVILDDPTKITGRSNITKRELINTLTDWRIYPHLLMTICALSPSSVMWNYAPTLVNSYGYPRLRSNALVSVGGWLLLIVNVSAGTLADWLKKRGVIVFGFLWFWWAFTLGNLIFALSESTNRTGKYALLTLSIAFSSPWHATNGSWLALNARSPGERSVRMAMFIMSANCSGIVGSQLFQASDAPIYKTGWTVIVCLISTGIVFCSFNMVQYWISNKRIDQGKHHIRTGTAEGLTTQSTEHYSL